MKRGSFAADFHTGLLVVGVTTTAYAAGIMAERSTHRVFVDGREVQMEAYRIKGNNYVKLRDIGRAVGFNIYWDSDSKWRRRCEPMKWPPAAHIPTPGQTVANMLPSPTVNMWAKIFTAWRSGP